MDDVARVVLALEAHDVAEEVMHFLDRSGRARVVATAADDRQLAEAVRQLEPDAVVAQPALVGSLPASAGVLLALDTRESVGSLRAALRAGAGGYFVWPGDREELGGAVAAACRKQPEGVRGSVVAVRAARGGAGATFIATHLAAALARRGASCVLIDADVYGADVTPALDLAEGGRTIADLRPLGDELTAETLEGALTAHAAGFRVLPAPPPAQALEVQPRDVELAVAAAAGGADVVVLHLPCELGPIGLEGLSLADRVLEVITLDVRSFRAAARTAEARAAHPAGRTEFVVNKAARSELVPGDVARAFGAPPLAVVPFDRGVVRAQAGGRLLPARGRVWRGVDRLAAAVWTPAPGEVGA